tara:strand:+ start:2442 stop:3974 length:1533 start_codon:yes stop_codon:yes gene_type:complete
MKTNEIPYYKTDQFSKLIIDYINEDEKIEPFISQFPRLENFQLQIDQKINHSVDRDLLVKVLRKQNLDISLSQSTINNISSLTNKSTFTITTGHQLCLFTGPLYFIYKIISVINLTNKLKKRYANYDFVPVFWMASEDHDLEEINHINLFGNRIEWDSYQTGSVGNMELNNIDKVLSKIKEILGEKIEASNILEILESCYKEGYSLAYATRKIVNNIFGKYGLVIIDGNDVAMKEKLIPLIKKDVIEQGFVETIKSCSDSLGKNYKVQAFVRDINFFKLTAKERELITCASHLDDIIQNPENFSPNVLLRPLYQEMILPNIAYIGGPSEVAYWMQLRTAFKQENIPFPILVLRNSAILLNEKQYNNFINLGFSLDELFLDEVDLHKIYVKRQDSYKGFDQEIREIESIYDRILERTKESSIQYSVRAEKQKQIRSFRKLENKFFKLDKNNHAVALKRITKLKENLFPKKSLQERYDNFIPFYLKDGENFIEILINELNPLASNFVILLIK